MLSLKMCKKCWNPLPKESFSRDPNRADGLGVYCRRCSSRAEWITCAVCGREKTTDKFAKDTKRCKTCDDDSGEQHCSKCRQILPVSFFYRSIKRKNGRHPRCKQCCKSPMDPHYRRRTTFGIEPVDYIKLLKKQKNVCAICSRPEWRTMRGKVRSLSIDHDHKTGKVRGLLCTDCNLGIGRLKDDPNLLRNAIKYLKRHQ